MENVSPLKRKESPTTITSPTKRSRSLSPSRTSKPPRASTNLSATHRADEKRFLDERGSGGALAPNGLNPATIMEKPVRERIVDCYFWKDQCFAVNEADIIDRVVEHVRFIGGTYGDSQKPSPFLCLAFKLLQLGPSDEILEMYLGYGGERFKYLRALAAFYIRLTRKASDVHILLEPHLQDFRKLVMRTRTGKRLTFVDEFIDGLLTKERLCSTTLWKMPSRSQLEDEEKLDPYVSPLGDIEDLLESEPEEIGREVSDESEPEDARMDDIERNP
jgi:pre-mRNA-splicing factor 38A